MYKHNYQQFGGSDNYKNKLAWRKVVGGIQRYVPAATAQVLCQSAYYIFIDEVMIKRSLKSNYGGPNFYPLYRHPEYRLGEDCAYDTTKGPGLCVGSATLASCVPEFFEAFCQRKLAVCHDFCSNERVEQKHCALM